MAQADAVSRDARVVLRTQPSARARRRPSRPPPRQSSANSANVWRPTSSMPGIRPRWPTSPRRRCGRRSSASCSARSSTRASTSGTADPPARWWRRRSCAGCCDLVGYGEGSFGLLTSGGVMANIMAMTIARDMRLGRLLGPRSPTSWRRARGRPCLRLGPVPLLAASVVSACWASRRSRWFRCPPTICFRLQAEPVAAAIAADRAAGLTPYAIVGTAGTTNTGSVDALADLGVLAEREGLWYPHRCGLRWWGSAV